MQTQPVELEQLKELASKAKPKTITLEWLEGCGYLTPWSVVDAHSNLIVALVNAFPAIARELEASRAAIRAVEKIDFLGTNCECWECGPLREKFRDRRDAALKEYYRQCKNDMPIQPKTVEQCVEEMSKNLHAFITPSNCTCCVIMGSGHSIAHLRSGVIEDFIRSVYASALRHAAEVLPTDALVGNGDYCLTCEQHIAAGDCNCDGVNYGLGLARAAILAEADKTEKV